MNTNSVPIPTPEDLATERLVSAVESAIDVMQERLANLADGNQDARWSVSDLVKLLQLRDQLQGERPRTVRACWVEDPRNHNWVEDPHKHNWVEDPRNHTQLDT